MQKSTGSVYLDSSHSKSRRPLAPRVSRTRTVVGGVSMTIGLVGLTAAAVVTALHVLVFEPAPIVEAFEAGFDDPESRAEIEAQIATAIEDGFVGVDLAEVADVWGIDIAAEAAAVSGAVADDPVFRAAFTDLVTDVHRQAVVEHRDTDIDLAPVSDAALDRIRMESPVLAALIPEGSTLWQLGPDEVPDLTVATAAFDQALLLSLVAAAGVGVAVSVHPRRHRIAAWLGRWFLVTGLVTALLVVGLPPLAGELTGWHTVETAVRATTVRLLAPATTAGLAGVALVSFGAVARRREARQVKEEGAKAALGVNEPPAWSATTSPELDLARRGLVDVEHPLTNI